MRKLWMLILVLAIPCMATDIPDFNVTFSVAADSSDSGLNRDTVYSDPFSIVGMEKLSFNYEISMDKDSNLSDDTIVLEIQTALHRGFNSLYKPPTWISVPSISDEIVLGGNDTTRYTELLEVTDSMFNFVRALGYYSVELDSAEAADLSGNTYTWPVKYWIDEKFK